MAASKDSASPLGRCQYVTFVSNLDYHWAMVHGSSTNQVFCTTYSLILLHSSSNKLIVLWHKGVSSLTLLSQSSIVLLI